jgi:hypothetical protein
MSAGRFAITAKLLHGATVEPPFRLLRLAARMRDSVDRILVLANAEQRDLIQVLLDSCCDPYFNQLSRGQRGSRPRITFVPTPFDVDDAHGVLQLLGKHPCRNDVESRWGLIAIREHDGQPELDPGMCFFAEELQRQFGTAGWRDFSVVIAPASDPWNDAARRAGCQAVVEPSFSTRHRWGGAQLHASGLLFVAALLGIDLVKLLAGASHAGRHFLDPQATENPSGSFVESQVACRLCSCEPYPEYHANARALHSYAHWCERQYRAVFRGLRAATPTARPWEAADARQTLRLPAVPATPLQPMPLQTVVQVERWRHNALATIDAKQPPNSLDVKAVRGCRTTRICLPCVHEGTIGQLLAISLMAMAAEFLVRSTARSFDENA